jgi:hypothetical protein
MEVGLANILFSWFLHIDLTCIVCNWAFNNPFDPLGLAAAAAAGWEGLAGDIYNSYASGGPRPPVVQGGPLGGTSLEDLFLPTLQIPGGGTGPLDPAPGPGNQPVDPHTLPPPPNAFDSDTAVEDKIAADAAEQQRLHNLNPGDTTAGPPAPTTAEQAGDAAYNAFFTVGTRPKVVQ